MAESLKTSPALTPDEEAHLCELLTFHRLERRFLIRCTEAMPEWCSESLVERVRSRAYSIAFRFQQCVRELRRVSSEIAKHQAQPVIAKGISAYAVTGKSATLRRSNDIDLFCEDLPAAHDGSLPDHRGLLVTQHGQ